MWPWNISIQIRIFYGQIERLTKAYTIGDLNRSLLISEKRRIYAQHSQYPALLMARNSASARRRAKTWNIYINDWYKCIVFPICFIQMQNSDCILFEYNIMEKEIITSYISVDVG